MSDDPRIPIVREIFNESLGEDPSEITLVPNQGNVNTSYFVQTPSGDFVLRARFDRGEMHQFRREKRCADLIRAAHEWTPQVIKIGAIENHCYSIQERVFGTVGSQYAGNMIDLWEQVGSYAKHFHQIKTNGYLFDLFREDPPSNEPWCQKYFSGLGEPAEAKLVQKELFNVREFEAGLRALGRLKELNFEPKLNHGNLTLDNLIVDSSGRAHILDWGTCQGHLPDLDLAELLVFETPIEHLRAYLRGHSLPVDYLEANSNLLDRLQLARLFTTANWLCEIDSPRVKDLENYLLKTRKLLKRLDC